MLGNCCDDSCYYVREKFNRANETPIRSPWEKLLPPPATPNTWNLRDEILDAIDPGTYRYNFAFPGGATDARHASVRFKLTEAGSVELLMAITPSAFLDQPYDWFSAWVYYDAAGCSYLSTNAFYHGLGYGGGVGPGITNSVNAPGLTLNEWHRLEACLIQNPSSYAYTGYNLIIAKLTCANGKVYSCQELSNTGQTIGAHGGLKYRKGSIGTCEFDDYEETYYRNSPTNEHRTCPWCRTPCLISQDDFAVDEPCLWDVISGSYTVAGGKMTITADGSKIQHHIFHPGLKTSQITTFDVLDFGISRIGLGNGYAILTSSAAGHTLKLYDNSATELDTDDDSDLGPFAADGISRFSGTACYSRGFMSVVISGTNAVGDAIYLCVNSAVDETANGYWVYLGGDIGATFYNFVFKKSYDTTDPTDKDCEQCINCLVCSLCEDDLQSTFVFVEWPEFTGQDCATCDDLPNILIAGEEGANCPWRASDSDTCGVAVGRSAQVSIVQLGDDYYLSAQIRWTAFLVFDYTFNFLSASLGTEKPDCTAFDRVECFFSSVTQGSPSIPCAIPTESAFVSSL